MAETLSIPEAIRRTIQKFILNIHTAMPGVVESYDATSQTADVRPLLKWADFLPGSVRSVFELPTLPNVLVCYPRGSGLGIHYPLSSGDLVLLIFCSRSIAGWRSQSSATTPADPGRALTVTPLEGAVALPLGNHDTTPLDGLSSGSYVNLGSDAGSLDFVALAQAVTSELDEFRTKYNSHTHNTSSGPSDPPLLAAQKNAIGDVAASDVRAT